MRKNFTAEQMLHTVRQAEGSMPAAEVCRKVGMTEQTFYRWKRRLADQSQVRLLTYHEEGLSFGVENEVKTNRRAQSWYCMPVKGLVRYVYVSRTWSTAEWVE